MNHGCVFHNVKRRPNLTTPIINTVLHRDHCRWCEPMMQKRISSYTRESTRTRKNCGFNVSVIVFTNGEHYRYLSLKNRFYLTLPHCLVLRLGPVSQFEKKLLLKARAR